MLQGNRFIIKIDSESKLIACRLIISITVMRIVIEYIYRTQISTVYNYSGFSNNFSLPMFVLSWIMMYSFVPMIVRCLKEPNFSKMVLYLLYLINFIPGTILMSYMEFPFLIPWYIYYFLLFLIGTLHERKQVINENHRYMNKYSIYVLAAFFSLFVLFVWFYYAHGRVQLGLDDVYSIRLEARDFGMPMVLRYIFASMKIVLPIFIVWALRNKNYFSAVLFSLIQLVAFFSDGSKSTLFSLIVSIIGYFFLRNKERRIELFPWILSGVGILSIFEFGRWGSYEISGIFFRRVMFVPQSLNFRYFDFFSNNPPDFFRGSFLKIFGFSSPYGSIARTIGRYYSGSNTLAANNGLFSDSFANLGYVGIIIMPIAVIVLLRFLDKYSADLEVYTIIGSVIPFTMALMSASYFTMFLTHGGVAMFLIFYFIPRVRSAVI